jgi:indole-3-glycerol phosphate synthase
MLSRVSPEGGYLVARALKRSVGEAVHQVSVIAEIKRRTPTGGETPTEVAAISDVGLVACQLAECGADVLMVATDGPCYGGSLEDLRMARAALHATRGDGERPPLVAKDLYIHPLQVAQAVEAGADGVLLMACLVRFVGVD